MNIIRNYKIQNNDCGCGCGSHGQNNDERSNCGCDGCDIDTRHDTELGADEVIRKEVFPQAPTNDKPLSEHTRPTNCDYRMIDPSGDTVDTGKS